ncbi:ABC transporter ATP-binding protein [Levilactobacillus suantsaiihabitans]|uniref:ABC transporter ATP-binding protein n=1 Tax=Levilactobacillus suantsaiihabitans TaxID=2487722 RepID=UPI001436AD2F|nr:ATP-binding cassette domain-containing protein [Levilactobacillus suantsaiihabitans]
MTEPIITIDHVSFDYVTYTKQSGLSGSWHDLFHRQKQRVPAVQNVSLQVAPGEILGLLGANGAGKTTLIKLMTGILPVRAGSLQLLDDQHPFQKRPAFLRRIGVMLSQKSQLAWDLPPLDTLVLLREIYQVPHDRFTDWLAFLTDQLAVTAQLKVPVRKLSLGQRIKFELICALIHTPEILFLDEPTIGIDVSSQANIYRFLQQLNRDTQMTIILTSHNTKDIEALAQRVAVINHGRKIFEGTPNGLIAQYASAATLEVVTDAPLTTLPAHVTQVADSQYLVDAAALTTLPIDPQHILSVHRRNGNLDDILTRLFSQEVAP